MDVESIGASVTTTTGVEKNSVLDELSNSSNFAQNTQREQVTALDNPSNKSSNLDKLLMEEAVEKQLDEVQHAQPVTKTQESISPASRAIAPSPAPPEPAAVTKPEDSEDVEEAMVATRTAEGIAPSPAPCEKAPLLQKTSVAVTESTHQFEAGDRVHHPVFGYGTLNEIIRTTAFCKFDKVPDSTGRIQRNAMRSLDISELRKVT